MIFSTILFFFYCPFLPSKKEPWVLKALWCVRNDNQSTSPPTTKPQPFMRSITWIVPLLRITGSMVSSFYTLPRWGEGVRNPPKNGGKHMLKQETFGKTEEILRNKLESWTNPQVFMSAVILRKPIFLGGGSKPGRVDLIPWTPKTVFHPTKRGENISAST